MAVLVRDSIRSCRPFDVHGRRVQMVADSVTVLVDPVSPHRIGCLLANASSSQRLAQQPETRLKIRLNATNRTEPHSRCRISEKHSVESDQHAALPRDERLRGIQIGHRNEDTECLIELVVGS
ncbi:hypothetical protein RB5839 [Rhodopirellula baltica SH 1]|uniref:Uncharacterized protein n=1 Tax=Rhodopirellula baltica (strain DSM 10527 / NCIMB 13988 / SH1) TaxID=243090 RepID=Q7UR77_RHOBA|nr:hypothetical protein RB5839 [Rhodopirellula baltica SH 1]